MLAAAIHLILFFFSAHPKDTTSKW